MCARYTVFTEEEMIEMRAIIDRISRKFGPRAIRTGEIFPSHSVPIVKLVNGKIETVPGTFGLPPLHPGGRLIINARSETAHEKPMFAKLLKTSRCVIPSTGYYEWSHEGKEAVDKYLLRQSDNPMLYMAGLADSIKDQNGGQRDHFVILTQAPSRPVAAIHNRMPVILRKDELAAWLRHEEYIHTVFSRPGPELLCLKAAI